MATFTISLTGSSVVNGSKSWTVSDADVQSLIDFMANKYAPFNKGKKGAPLTPAQALLAWAQGFVRQTVGEIQAKKRTQAQAAVSVAPLSFT